MSEPINLFNQQSVLQSRRAFLQNTGMGLGAAAMASLVQRAGATSQHFAPRAKRVIFLFMAGAPSQLDLFDYKPFETWDEEGARDTQALASLRVQRLVDTYVQPPLDPEIEARLRSYVADKKATMPDSFM